MTQMINMINVDKKCTVMIYLPFLDLFSAMHFPFEQL